MYLLSVKSSNKCEYYYKKYANSFIYYSVQDSTKVSYISSNIHNSDIYKSFRIIIP